MYWVEIINFSSEDYKTILNLANSTGLRYGSGINPLSVHTFAYHQNKAVEIGEQMALMLIENNISAEIIISHMGEEVMRLL